MMRHTTLLILFALFALPGFAQEYQPLLDQRTRDLLHESLSGETAKEHVIAITRWSRVQGSRQYRDAGQYVLGQLRSAGFGEEGAWVESFPSDGKIHYQTWQSPPGFDMTRAELRIVSPREERIVGYPEIGMSLMTYSNPGEFTGELVWVGQGTSPEDYAGKNLEGKIALATGYGGSVHRLAVLEHGALGVVCFLDDERAREYPDMLQYTGMWPRASELERVTFGFNLTNRQGRMLLGLIESGESVVVQGRAEGVGLEPYFMDVVVAEIRGAERPDDVLVVSAHLDHPKESANDNASGSAAALDLAITLNRLIAEGKLSRPRRTLRFLWVPEFYGTMAYIDAHPEIAGPDYGGSVLANLNLDMVGEHQELLHSRAIFTRTPASIPSVLNDVVENMVQMVAGMEIRTPRGSLSTFNFAVTPFSGGSDHMMFIDRRVPGMMFGHSPDYTHHTSEDTPDKVDPVELEREEIIAGATLLYLSDLDPAQATELAWLAGANAARDLGLAARKAYRLAEENPAPRETAQTAREARNILDRRLEEARKAVTSIRHFRDDDGSAIDAVLTGLDAQHAALVGALEQRFHDADRDDEGSRPSTEAADTRVAVRTTRGPIDSQYLTENLGENDLAWYRSGDNPFRGNAQFELHNLIDGTATLSQVRDRLSAEFSPVTIEAVARYVESLERIELVRWK